MKTTPLLLLPLFLAGCASQADYQPSAGHPAAADSADASPPSAGDPFAVEGRPVEAQADPDQGGLDHQEMSHDMSGMQGMNDMAGMSHDDHAMHEAAAPTTQPTADAYPMTTCPVTGAKLGSMGEPIDVEVKGRIVKVCCPGCVETVKADPGRYLAMLDEAEHASHAPVQDDGGHQ